MNRRRRRRDAAWAALFLAPAAAILGLFVFYPLGRTFHLSLYRVGLFGRGRRWVGISQWGDVLTSPTFRNSMTRSALLVAMVVPTAIVLGLLLALLANRPARGLRWFRVVFASTICTSAAVAAVMARTILNPSTGWLRYVLTRVGALDSGNTVDVLHDPRWALPAVAVTIIWAGLGSTFIVVLAALQSVPDELLEAARLDGAGPVGRFFGVTLPHLAPTLVFLSTVGVIGGLLTFGEIDILTQGGPQRRTDVVAYSLWRTAFRDNDQGTAAAMSVLLFAAIAALTAVQLVLLRNRVRHEH